MPLFKPFKGLRPHRDHFETFPTHPLANYSDEELEIKAQTKDSYIHMVYPYLQSQEKTKEKTLKKVRNNFEDYLKRNVLQQDETSYYLYVQIHPDKSIYRGLLGLVSIEEFKQGKIKKHESTLPQRKEKLAEYLDKTGLQSEPVLLTYPANPKLELIMNHEEKSVPVINYSDSMDIRHKVWRISNRLQIQQIKEVIDQIPSFYIADGHHRMGSTALNAEIQKEKNKRHSGNEAYNFVYGFIVSNQSIKIHDYNRIIINDTNLSVNEILNKLSENFHIVEKGKSPYYPSRKHHLSMYMKDTFYSLNFKEECYTESGLDSMDHYLFEKFILKPLFDLEYLNSSKKVKFVHGDSGIKGIEKIKEKVDALDNAIGFGISPVRFNDLVKLSDLDLKVPPKSTYIQPKPVTAMLMYDMKQQS